jgi:hypothetical protein
MRKFVIPISFMSRQTPIAPRAGGGGFAPAAVKRRASTVGTVALISSSIFDGHRRRLGLAKRLFYSMQPKINR